MQTKLLSPIFIFAVLFSLTTWVHASVTIDEAAPTFTLTDTQGKTLSLADYKGKTVVLEWTNHECPFVKKHYDSGNMQALQKEFTEKGIIWLSVVSSAEGKQGFVNAAEGQKILEEQKATPTAKLLDPEGKVGRLYAAQTTPHMFVIDAAGKIAYMGAIDDIPSADKNDIAKANNYVRAALNNILAGKAVETAVTKPYGCSVKY